MGCVMKPDWKDAPKWAKWLAQDYSGQWCWFEKKPTKHEKRCWIQQDYTDFLDFNSVSLKINPDWKDTLERRPKGVT